MRPGILFAIATQDGKEIAEEFMGSPANSEKNGIFSWVEKFESENVAIGALISMYERYFHANEPVLKREDYDVAMHQIFQHKKLHIKDEVSISIHCFGD